MKVLFIVQGEGRGHMTQAITLADALRANGHEVVEVLVGKSKSRSLPRFFREGIKAPVEQFESPNFLPTPANKRSKITRSVAYNVCRLHRYASSMLFLNKRIKESGANLVVNFYELLTGLTYLLFQPEVPQVSIGHQYLFLHPAFKLPQVNKASLLSLRLFTIVTSLGASERLALSFREMDDDEDHHICVVPPLIRKDVLALTGTKGNYLHGYMVNAGFGECVMAWHKEHPEVPLNFFWDKKGAAETERVDDTLTFHQIDDRKFIESMAGCMAYATTAGFESVCEAMYLGKPIMMVPAHIEQDCNAYDACQCGAGIVSNDFNIDRLLDFASHYQPNVSFHRWAQCGGSRITASLEKAACNHETRSTGLWAHARTARALIKRAL